MSAPHEWIVTDLAAPDRPAWEQLYLGYGEHYQVEMPPVRLDRVWGWLHSSHELDGIGVRVEPGAPPVGLAHYRPFARPLYGSTGCYLDDLFVAPEARGTGAVDALLAELRRRSRANGWDVVRWITHESNARARSAYDRLAAATPYVTYDLSPAGPGES